MDNGTWVEMHLLQVPFLIKYKVDIFHFDIEVILTFPSFLSFLEN